MWKPGQIVTINGKVYRVKKEQGFLSACDLCSLQAECFRDMPIIASLCDYPEKVPSDCYLEEIQCGDRSVHK